MLENIINLKEDYSLQMVYDTINGFDSKLKLSEGLPAEEAYNILIIPFTGTINLIHSIVMNFASRILKITKIVKRSELKVYHDRFHLNCLRAFKVNYIDIADIDISVPNNMKSSYYETVQNIKYFFDYVTPNLLIMYKNNMEDLYKYLSTNNMVNFSFHPELYKKSEIDTIRENLFIKHTGDFSSKVKDLFVPFKDKFKNIEEFKNTDKVLLSLNEVLVGINKIVSTVHDTVTVTDKVVYYMQHSENFKEMITPEFIKNLSEYVRSMAEAYDMYASVVESQLSIEHNFVKVIEKIYEVS